MLFFDTTIDMMVRNHVPSAMFCQWLFVIASDIPLEAHGTMAEAIEGLLPDLDHPKSVLGRRILFISLPLSVIFGHRGMTHGLLAAISLTGILVAVTTRLPTLR